MKNLAAKDSPAYLARLPLHTLWGVAGSTCESLRCTGLSSGFLFLFGVFWVLLNAFCVPSVTCAQAQRSSVHSPSATNAGEETSNNDAPLPGDWAPELLDGILSSPNQEAQDALYRAAFAAGPSILPQLAVALDDDRTAEFAAQELAFIGGEKAIELLWKLQEDKRDLNLRRFYYGALGEFDSPQATDTLLDVIRKSDAEPDRSVTEAAILALTVRSDPNLLPRLRELESKVQDVVIQDDLQNAIAVIGERVKYLNSPEGKKVGGSVEAAVHTYFIAGLEPPPPSDTLHAAQSKTSPPKSPTAGPAPKPAVSAEVERVTLSPDKTRALARVTFEAPTAVAEYDMVFQKHEGNWKVASVWLQSETEKAEPAPPKPAGPKP